MRDGEWAIWRDKGQGKRVCFIIVLPLFMFLYLNLLEKEGNGRRGDGDI